MQDQSVESRPKSQTIIRASTGFGGMNLKSLWKYRELLWMLAMREVSLRYRQTVLGVTWVILQPVLTTVIFTIIFGTLMKAPSDNVTYALFTFAGMLPWNIFSQSLQRAGISLTKDIRLVTKIFFPRIIIPVSNAISTVVDFLVSAVILVGLMIFYHETFTLRLLTIPLFIILDLILAIGVGVIFAALNVYYRDFTYVLPFVIQVWLYASPIAYSAKLIPASWEWVYNLNPIVGIITGFRWAVFSNIPFPGQALMYSFISSIAIFVIGMIIFHRLEKSFADVI